MQGAVEGAVKEYDKPGVGKMHHEDVGQRVLGRCVIERERGRQFMMPIDQSKTAINTLVKIVFAHLISLIAPVWSRLSTSTLSPYLPVSAAQSVMPVAYKVFMIRFPICISLTVSKNAVLSMRG